MKEYERYVSMLLFAFYLLTKLSIRSLDVCIASSLLDVQNIVVSLLYRSHSSFFCVFLFNASCYSQKQRFSGSVRSPLWTLNNDHEPYRPIALTCYRHITIYYCFIVIVSKKND